LYYLRAKDGERKGPQKKKKKKKKKKREREREREREKRETISLNDRNISCETCDTHSLSLATKPF